MKLHLLIYLACLSVLAGMLLAQNAKFVKLQNVDTKLTANDDIEHSNIVTVTSCIKHCTQTSWCVYISYNEDQDSCFLHQINGVTAVSSEGWTIYFKVLDENGITTMNLKNGATASQTTTYYDPSQLFYFIAELAIDGNKATNLYDYSCAVPEKNVYWIMQFGMAGVVDKIDIYLRSDYVARNSNRKAWVAQTDDVAGGTVCGNYTGPLIDQLPYMMTIKCDAPIFGKFLGIFYMGEDAYEMCEVEVFSP